MSDFEEQEGEDDYTYEEEVEDEDYEYTNDECDTPELKRESSYPDAFRVPDGGYNVLEYSDMVPLMNAMIKESTSVLGVSVDNAMILLSHYGWNKEKLLDTYWADIDSCLASAGISSSSSSSSSVLGDPTLLVSCKICYDEIPVSDTIHLGCRHTFCRYVDSRQ